MTAGVCYRSVAIGENDMQLKIKFIIMIAFVTCCSYGVTFYRTSSFQEDLVVQQATRQAKMLFNQIRITRQWVADHNGLFLVKAPGVEENPFLNNSQIQDEEGNWLVALDPMKASATPQDITVSPAGGKPVVVKNVLVGDVWFVGRQSYVDISLGRSPDEFIIIVRDNGRGLPEPVEPGLGLEIVETLVKEDLQGRLKFNRPPQGGTEVSLRLPRTIEQELN